jgi:hypothetical protein
MLVQDGRHFRLMVEPFDERLAIFAVFETPIQLLANFGWQTGNFAWACHVGSFLNS